MNGKQKINILTILVLLMSIALCRAEHGWELVGNLEMNCPVPRGLFFSSETEGWLGNAMRPIAHHTSNGGIDWEEHKLTNAVILDFYFINPDTGWFVGDSAEIKRTTNGGEEWTQQHFGLIDGLEFPVVLYDILFTSSNEGWAVGGYWIIDGGVFDRETYVGRLVLHTENCGVDWEIAFIESYRGDVNPDVGKPTKIAVSDSLVIVTLPIYPYSRSYSVLVSKDKGENWRISETPCDPYSIVSLGNETFIVGGFEEGRWQGDETSMVIKSENGGDDWDIVYSTNERERFSPYSISFMTDSIGWIGGTHYESFMLKTVDGGDTWNELFFEDSETHPKLVQFINETTGFAVFYKDIYEIDIYQFKDDNSIDHLKNTTSNLPESCSIDNTFPNPFNSRINIHVNATMPISKPKLLIYSLSGKVVRNLSPFNNNLNNHLIFIWDGKNQNGDNVAAASYFVEFVSFEKKSDCIPITFIK
ncbi:MAG: YCF48-related protein [Candidatus Hatepunaea meridiana]|nr:YCF48-related protein [Candidatus Hatepunaea meridiana]